MTKKKVLFYTKNGILLYIFVLYSISHKLQNRNKPTFTYIPQTSNRSGKQKTNKRKLWPKWRQDSATPVILILSSSFLQFILMRSDYDRENIYMIISTRFIQSVYHFISDWSSRWPDKNLSIISTSVQFLWQQRKSLKKNISTSSLVSKFWGSIAFNIIGPCCFTGSLFYPAIVSINNKKLINFFLLGTLQFLPTEHWLQSRQVMAFKEAAMNIFSVINTRNPGWLLDSPCVLSVGF